MTEFTGVISTTGLDPLADEAVLKNCPREILGLACISGQYVCLCQQVETSEVYVRRNDRGEAASLTVELNLVPNVGTPDAVMAGIELTGYKAGFQASKDAVVVTFRLNRPQNLNLNMHVRESGY